MNNRQHSPSFGEQDNDVEVLQRAPLAGASRGQQSTRWSARRRRNALLLLGVLLLGVVTIYALSLGSVRPSGQANGTQPGTPLATETLVRSTPPPALSGTGEFREFPLPQSDSQLMRLAIDHEGRLWFGEMGRNFLAVFDPRTQMFQQMTPPRGRSGVMSVQVASDDTIWFVEQYANYIGHYFPRTERYQVYPLPTLTVPDPSHAGKTLTLPSAPNELALDAHSSTVWFTELNADALGRLDPGTGRVQQYPLSAKRSVEMLLPYGVTIDALGMIWFTEVSGDRIGRLDPATGHIRLFTPPRPDMLPMEIASDAHGIIWVTSFNGGLLLRLDSRTGAFTPFHTPFSGPDTGGLYGLAVTPAGEIWVTILAQNAIARLDVGAHRFLSYAIPSSGSEPLGIVMGVNHTLWFTEIDKIGMLRL